MHNDDGTLSIDFLAGMTLFMVAFIWVATMIPGLLIGLQGKTVDKDAIAYRTGVILVEDPGMPASPPWENKDDLQKGEIERFGLALSRDTPNIISHNKVARFFCSTSFSYPDDYQTRIIFGDRPYSFNISLSYLDMAQTFTVGSLKPDGYGYIRRLVKIKQASNATIHAQNHRNSGPSANVTTHLFTVQMNCSHLIQDERNLAYQVNPLRDQIMINITNLSNARVFTTLANNPSTLESIKIFRQNPAQPVVQVRTIDDAYIDGGNRTTPLPSIVNDNVTLIIPPGFFYGMASDSTQLFVTYTFNLSEVPVPMPDNFFNNSYTSPYLYDYNPINVTPSILREGVIEVAVW